MDEILKLLDDKGIKYDLVKHDPVYTMEDIHDIGLDNNGYIPKNVFVRNANGKVHYLVSCDPNKKIDFKELASKLNSTRLSFASSERLKKYLNVEQGAVSPFGVVFDTNSEVIVVFDNDLTSKEKVGFHPNKNTATIFLDFNDLIKIIEEHGNKIMYINI